MNAPHHVIGFWINLDGVIDEMTRSMHAQAPDATRHAIVVKAGEERFEFATEADFLAQLRKP